MSRRARNRTAHALKGNGGEQPDLFHLLLAVAQCWQRPNGLQQLQDLVLQRPMRTSRSRRAWADIVADSSDEDAEEEWRIARPLTVETPQGEGA